VILVSHGTAAENVLQSAANGIAQAML